MLDHARPALDQAPSMGRALGTGEGWFMGSRRARHVSDGVENEPLLASRRLTGESPTIELGAWSSDEGGNPNRHPSGRASAPSWCVLGRGKSLRLEGVSCNQS